MLTKLERGETTTSNHRASHERRSLRHQPLSPEARDLTSTPSLPCPALASASVHPASHHTSTDTRNRRKVYPTIQEGRAVGQAKL